MLTNHPLSPEASERAHAQRHYDAFLAENDGAPSNIQQSRYVRLLLESSNLDGVAHIIQNKLIEVDFSFVKYCPAHRLDAFVRMLVEAGVHESHISPEERLFRLPPPMFKFMLEQGVNMERTLCHAARECDDLAVTDILTTAWNLRLVTEELLASVHTAWTESGKYLSREPIPSIILAKQRALTRIQAIKQRNDEPFATFRSRSAFKVATRAAVTADLDLERAVLRHDPFGAYIALLRGAALDGEMPERAPIRLAAENAEVECFRLLLATVEHPIIEHLPGVARAAALRGGPRIIKLLVDKVGTPDFENGALLYHAVEAGDKSLVAFMLNMGANPLAGRGRAWHLSRDVGTPEIVAMIDNAVAQREAALQQAVAAKTATTNQDGMSPAARTRRPRV
jgi:hypothetical protein